MIRKPKQMSESMILGVVLTLAGGFQDAYSYQLPGAGFSPTRRLETLSCWAKISPAALSTPSTTCSPCWLFLAGYT